MKISNGDIILCKSDNTSRIAVKKLSEMKIPHVKTKLDGLTKITIGENVKASAGLCTTFDKFMMACGRGDFEYTNDLELKDGDTFESTEADHYVIADFLNSKLVPCYTRRLFDDEVHVVVGLTTDEPPKQPGKRYTHSDLVSTTITYTMTCNAAMPTRELSDGVKVKCNTITQCRAVKNHLKSVSSNSVNIGYADFTVTVLADGATSDEALHCTFGVYCRLVATGAFVDPLPKPKTAKVGGQQPTRPAPVNVSGLLVSAKQGVMNDLDANQNARNELMKKMVKIEKQMSRLDIAIKGQRETINNIDETLKAYDEVYNEIHDY